MILTGMTDGIETLASTAVAVSGVVFFIEVLRFFD